MKKDQFEKFNSDIEKEVASNLENYNAENYKVVNVESIDSNLITVEIIADVIRFIKEPKLKQLFVFPIIGIKDYYYKK